jgi:hypothetical protein
VRERTATAPRAGNKQAMCTRLVNLFHGTALRAYDAAKAACKRAAFKSIKSAQ